MSSYDYVCATCGGTQEVIRAMSDSEIAPICCGSGMNRIYTAPGVKFNASGFYSTDNRR